MREIRLSGSGEGAVLSRPYLIINLSRISAPDSFESSFVIMACFLL